MNVKKESHYKEINDDRVAELTQRLDRATKDAKLAADEKEDTKIWWRRFCMIAFLSLIGLVTYWIHQTNDRWKETNQVSKLEAELNLVHEKTISRKDERLVALVGQVEFLKNKLNDAEALKFTLVNPGKKSLVMAYDRSSALVRDYISTYYQEDFEHDADQLGKWWNWKNLGDAMPEARFLLGRQLLNNHYEIHRLRRGAREEEDGSADLD